MFESIIFDLDGTLVDTAEDVRHAVNYLLTSSGYPEITDEKLQSMLGYGARHLIREALRPYENNITDERIDQALSSYFSFYKKNPVIDTKIYPGVREVLSKLQCEGFKLGICTNKPSVLTTLVLDRLELSSFFSAIVSGDEVIYPKPHANHLLAVQKKLRLENLKTILVGDSEVDRECAIRAGVPFIGVNFNAHSNFTPNELVITDFYALPLALNKIADGLKNRSIH